MTSHSSQSPYSAAETGCSVLMGKPNWIREPVVVIEVRHIRHGKQINVESINIYKKILGHASVGNGPHFISLVARIL